MLGFVNDIRIRTIGIAIPSMLVLLVFAGLAASGFLLEHMWEVRTTAFDPQGSPDRIRAVQAGIDELSVLLRGASVLYALLLVSLATFFLWFTRIRLQRPIADIERVMIRLAAGDNAVEVPRTDQRDEIGSMARALEVFKRHAIELESCVIIKSEKEGEIALKREMLSLADALEGEVHGTITEVVGQGERMVSFSTDVASAVQEANEQTRSVAGASEHATDNVNAVAAATEELAASSREIASQMARTTQIARTAVDQAEQAGTTMQELSAVSQKIGEVLKLINSIASQTNLLALNATIEAARAGEAGKGFAVVASEVKVLANQTATAVDTISGQINGILSATQRGVVAIQDIGRTIHEVNQIAAAVAAAVEQQEATTREISANAQNAAARTCEVASAIGTVSDHMGRVGSLSGNVHSTSVVVTDKLSNMERRLKAILRQSIDGNRRTARKSDAIDDATLRIGGRQVPCTIADLGLDGGLVRAAGIHAAPGTKVDLLFPEIGVITAVVRAADGDSLRLDFALDDILHARLGEFLYGHEAADQPYINAVKGGAAQIRQIFETALGRGELSLEDLFDENYTPIPGSNPQQLMARFSPFLDRTLPPIQEPLSTLDPRVAFCVAVDRNGYCATHNARCSHPQGSDPVWNAAHCRNRRLFNNPRELAAARNTKDYLLQTYLRDMGGGEVIMLKDVSSPITIRGRHWGSLRIGYSL